MTKIIGLTGGIASGKSTITKFLKKQKIPIHDSDEVVFEIYKNPSRDFIKYLHKIKLHKAINKGKINKPTIRNIIFKDKKIKKYLEKYIHTKVKKSREQFIKKQKKLKTDLVVLDIPLLFENKLEKICDFTILVFAPIQVRKKRAIKRRGMNKKILNNIIKNQLSDTIKKKKSHYSVNTSARKNYTFKKILDIIKSIKEK